MLKKLKLLFLAATLSTSLCSFSWADENVLFNYTHMLPSPYTLSAGRLVLGTYIGIGVTDFFQIGTNVLRDFYKVYNVSAKMQLLDTSVFALALTGGIENYNYKDIYPTNPDLTVTTYMPGAVMAFALAQELALFTGGNLVISKGTLKSNEIETSGYVRGARAEVDLSWAYATGKKSIGNVLSAGVSNDFTFDMPGYGISHHWPGFHLGLHYYPTATRYKVLPIIAGGAVIDI